MSKIKTGESSSSTQSASNKPKRIAKTSKKPDASLIASGPAKVLSDSSPSRLASLYEKDEFLDEWSNDVRFHVARNLLHLRRYRQMSQQQLADASRTSQSAIARIETARENITLDTLARLVNALRGRLSISIPPREKSAKPLAWWAGTDHSTNTWNVIQYATRRLTDRDQALVGLERMHPLPGTTPALMWGTVTGTEMPTPGPGSRALGAVAGIQTR